MSLTVYADAGALADWLPGPVPDTATSLLRSASFVVAAASNRDPYNDTPNAAEAQPLADATCAQVAAWVAGGVDPNAAGLDDAPVKASKIGTASIERDTTGAAAARLEAATQLAPEARRILYAAGLLALDLPVWTSSTDQLPDYGLERPLSAAWPYRTNWPC